MYSEQMHAKDIERKLKDLGDRQALIQRLRARYQRFEFSFRDKDEDHWYIIAQTSTIVVEVGATREDHTHRDDSRPNVRIVYQPGDVKVNGQPIKRLVTHDYSELQRLGLARSPDCPDPEGWFDFGIASAAAFLEGELAAMKNPGVP